MRNFTLQSLFAPKKRLLLLIVMCFMTFMSSNAQNLISNGGFEGTGGYTSNYSLIPSPTGNSTPGQYAITTNPKPVNTANFVTSTDHSGTGNMMIVDGQNNDIFYKYVNLPIQRGLDYTFTYWVKNVNNVTNAANPAPKIDLTLSNQCPCTKTLIAGNSDVGAMPSGWNKVSYTINVPGTGTAYIHFELSTNSAGGGGNDFAIDDVSLYAPPAPLTVSTSLTNPSCPTGNDGVIVAYPNGGVAPFTFTLSGAASASNSTGIFQNLAGGSYTVSVTDSNSPTSTKSTPATLTAPPDITLNVSPTGCIMSGASVTLTAANGGATYGWSASPGGAIAGTSSSIVVNPTVSTTYTVTSTTIPPSVGNLIGNPGFENGTSGFYSDYGYSLTNTSGTQFAYGIVTNPSTWYNKFTTCGDKTTGTGNMLVADGATIANSVIWSQTVPVETSKTYNFSFWVQNIGDGSFAAFQVLVNGSPMTISPVSATNTVTAGTPATTTCNWTKITGTWNSSAATLATIKIIDTNISSGGNDFAIDDLSFSTTSSKSCPLSTSKLVTIGGTAPVIGFSYTTPVCKTGTNPTPTGVSGFVTGGTYSSTSGLSINSTTGAIDLATSTAGTYTVTYAVAANAATCQLAGSSTSDITINAQPVAGTSGSTTVCESSTVSINLSSLITGEQAGGTWTRTTGTGGTFNATSGTFTPAVGAATSTFTYTLTGTAPCVNSSSVATVNINPQPVAGTSGNTTVCESSTASINLSSLITGEQSGGTWTRTTGTGGTFNAASGSFTPAVGATTSTFTYTLTGTSPCVNSSSVATVNINAQPVAGTSGNTTVCESSTASINLFSLITGEQTGGTWTRTTGTGGIFNAASGSFTPAVGATTSTFTYTLTGTSPCVNSSSVATVNINAQPVAGTSGNTTVCESSAVSINLSGLITGEQTGGIWTRTTGTGGTFNAASGSFTPAVGATASTFTYTLTGTSPCVNSSSVATVNINPQPVAGISGNTTVCESSGTSINLFSLITGEQVGGSWTRTSGTGGTFNVASGTFTPAIGATTSDFTYTLTGTSPCVNSSSIATVNINPVPVLTVSCGASTVSSVTFNWNAISGATSYNYSYSIDSAPPVTGSVSGTTFTVNSLTPGQNVAITLTSVGNMCITTGNGNCVSSNCPAPTVDTIADITTICTNGTVIVPNFTSPDPGVITFNWASNNTAIGVAANGTGNIPPFTAVNPTAVVQTATISVTAFDGTCTGPANTFKISINPLPTAGISGTGSICSGTGTNITFTGTPNAVVTYTVNSGSNQTITLNSSGSAVLATGNLTVNTDYNLVSVSNPSTGCSQPQTGTASVTIDPLPTAGISGTGSICSGTGTNITFSGTPNAVVTYTINSGSNQTITLNSSGSAVLPTGNLTANADYSLVSVADPSTGCSQVQTGTASVTINPLPTVVISGTVSICSGTGANITFTGTPNAVVTFAVNSGSNQTITLDGTGSAVLATGNLTANTSYSLVSVSNPATSCSQVQAGTATVTINPLPTAGISGTTSVCSGTGTSITFSGTADAVVTYTINSGSNQTITLNPSGSAVLMTGNLTVNTDYSLVSVSNPTTGCSQVQTGSASVTINSLPTAGISGTASICSGTGANITFTGTPNAAISYTVNNGPNQTIVLNSSGSAVLPTGNLTANTDYSLVSVLNPATGCSQSQAGTASITINPLPTVSISGTASICYGNGTNIIFTGTPNVTATYTVNGGSNQTIVLDGTGSAVLPTGSLTANVDYTLVSVSNPSTGCSQVQTGTASVTVNPLPTAGISGATAICSGTGTNIAFSGTPNTTVTYTVNSGSNQTIALDASGVAALSTGNLTINTDYSLVSVLNSATGCSQAQTGNAVVTVIPLPTITLTSAAVTTNQILCQNTALTLITYSIGGSASGAGVTGLPAGVTGSFSGGTFTISGIPTVDGIFNYAVTTTGGCLPAVTLQGTIAVKPLSTLVLSTPVASTAQTICLNDSVASISYIVGGSATSAVVSGLPAGVTGSLVSDVFTINGIPTVSGTYNYSVSTVGGCDPVITLNGTITINPLPVADFTGTTTVCSGNATALVLSSTIPGTSFSWNAVQNNVTGASSGSGSAINQTLTATGNSMGQVVYNVTPMVGSCIGVSKMITIDVSPVPNVVENTAKKTLCSGETTSIDLSSAIVGTLFSWTVNANGVTGAVAGSGDKIEQLLSNAGFVAGTVDYIITPSINGCAGAPVTVTINVNPMPEVLGTPPGTICSGDSTNITLSPTIAGTVFDWTVVQSGVTGATAGTGDTIKQVLEATGTSQGNAIYTITPSLNGCTGTPLDIKVYVNPSPKPTLKDGVICVEEATGVAFKTYSLDSGLSESNYNFQWYFNSSPVSGAVSSVFEAAQAGDYSVEAVNNITGCHATSEIAKVNASYPGLSITTKQTLAFADNATVEVNVSGGNAVFEYQLDNGSFQTSNMFENLKPGPHTITVEDENGCTNLTQNFFVIGYPKFFSPNGDGHNEKWNVVGLEDQPKSNIFIFDRYGKLIKQINPSGEGWDGNYTGQPLPATDYWFTVEFSEQSEIKLFKAHFSLIR